MTHAPMPAKIAAAIAQITGEIGAVEKRGKNEFHRYNYATAADILHKAQPLFAANGLIITPFQVGLDFIADGAAVALTFEFCLSHESGETWGERPRFTGVASARNSKGGFDDKCANKCLTSAQKYFMLALFKIPTGDYPDADADEDKPPVKTAEDKPAAKAPPPVEPLDVTAPKVIRIMTTPDTDLPDWIGWGQLFTATIRACRTAEQLDAWLKLHEPILKNMRENAPERLAKRVDAVIADCLQNAPAAQEAA